MKIELTKEEFADLLVTLGYAAGAALKMEDRVLTDRILMLANRINKDNPNWTPYEVPK